MSIAVVGHYRICAAICSLQADDENLSRALCLSELKLAYQFVHVESYSVKGREGRGVDFVLAEAARRPDACGHVPVPLPPELVFGVGLDEVRRIHDERVTAATTTTKAGKTRRIRSDQNTLLTVVASHPATMDEVRTQNGTLSAVREWERHTVCWLHEQFGPQLLSIVRHVDEGHPHLHAFIIPDDREVRAARLHPGQRAKADAVAKGKADGLEGKQLNGRGDEAYRSALRRWQDSYWKRVGILCGLTRLGPKRRRLSRGEWHAEKAQAAALREARERASALRDAARTFVANTRTKAETVLQSATEEAEAIRASAASREREATRLRSEAEAQLREASTIAARSKAETENAKAALRAEASKWQSWGARFRALCDGLCRPVLKRRLKDAAAREIEKARKEAEAVRIRALEETQRRRHAEREREAAVMASFALGRERDAARRELEGLRATSEKQNIYSLGGRRP